MRRLADQHLDLPVGGRDDLKAAVEVHLVAVVGRRIVRRGDLNTGRGPEMPDAERDYRCRYGGEHQRHVKPLGGKDFGCRERELLRAVPGVAADNDPRFTQAAVLEHLGDGPAGSHDDSEVHPVGAATQRSTQARRAERQRMREALGDLLVAACLEFGRRHRIGVMRDPFPRGRCSRRLRHQRRFLARGLVIAAQCAHFAFRVSQLAQHRSHQHQQVELQLGEVVAHGCVQPGVAFGAIVVEQTGTCRSELDELTPTVIVVGAPRHQPPVHQLIDAVGERLHPHVQPIGQLGRGAHAGPADLAEDLHLGQGQPVVGSVAAHLPGHRHHRFPQLGGRRPGAHVGHYQVIPW